RQFVASVPETGQPRPRELCSVRLRPHYFKKGTAEDNDLPRRTIQVGSLPVRAKELCNCLGGVCFVFQRDPLFVILPDPWLLTLQFVVLLPVFGSIKRSQPTCSSREADFVPCELVGEHNDPCTQLCIIHELFTALVLVAISRELNAVQRLKRQIREPLL